jgi:AraC-like DNA-binding protein
VVERPRIEVARQRVQSSSEAIERVAQVTCFRDPERMRRAFIRAFGQPPQSLRRARGVGPKCGNPNALSAEIQTPLGPASVYSLIVQDQADPGTCDGWIA